MLKILVLLHLTALTALTAPRAPAKDGDRRTTRGRESGSVTTEHVLWAVAVIAIVGIVVAAVTSYVQAQSGKIK